ncbi:hypothetical protein ACFSGX_00085 [Sphingomonas arantia]|uniref:Uncharacterized protein n=1 Tax=Sphingomonas arantia TaxID=1460676 RepID=A0ABW4TUN7_9SPHN
MNVWNVPIVPAATGVEGALLQMYVRSEHGAVVMADAGRQVWFRAKSFGYGAGMPVAWQGWALLVGSVGALVAVRHWLHGAVEAGAFVGILAVMVVLAARHTEGGAWRWRWGS